MTSVLLLLDEIPAGAEPDPTTGWFTRIDESLARDPQAWESAIARVGELSDEHGWSLLSWIEVAASQIVRTRSPDAIARAAFAMTLVLRSSLDRRDCAIVASLLRRASELAHLDFIAGVADGCARAGEAGLEAQALLEHASARVPSTHVESGANETFSFTRVAPGFDVDDLERWLEGDGL